MRFNGRYGYVFSSKQDYYTKENKLATKVVWYYSSYFPCRKPTAIRKREIVKYLIVGDDLDQIVNQSIKDIK